MSKNLILAARLVAIFGILFLASFALDTLVSGIPLGGKVIALIIQLMPACIVAAFLSLAWRFPGPGGWGFMLLGLAPFVFLDNPIPTNMMLGLPFLVAGGLFIAGAATKA